MSCPEDKIVYDSELNAYVCIETGEVLEDRPIVSAPQGRREEESPMVLASPVIHNYGIGTELSRIDQREAKSVTLHSILWRMVRRLGLPRYIHEDSARMLRELVRRGLIIGRKREEVIVATIYSSIRKHGLPIGLGELCKEMGVDKRRVWSMYKTIVEEFKLKQKQIPIHVYISQVVSRMGLEYRDYQEIIDSLLSRLPADLRYRKPQVVAQSLVLLALLIKRGRLKG